MVIKRSSQAEVTRLLDDLAGGDGVRREAAAARLAVLGPRAVDRLTGVLAQPAGDDLRLAVLSVLERIDDPRIPAAVRPLLGEAAPELAVAAVAAMRPHLVSPTQAAANEALDALAALVVDVDRPDAVRAAALDALHDLPLDVVEPLEVRLRDDPSPRLRRLAGAQGEADAPVDRAAPEPFAEGPLPADPDAVRAAIVSGGSGAPLSRLHRLVVAISRRETEIADPIERERWTMARAAAHQALGARGSRVALYDLREALESKLDPLPLGMLVALGQVGDTSCLEPLAAAAGRTASDWQRDHLLDAARRIVRRERLTRRQAVVRRLVARHPWLALAFE